MPSNSASFVERFRCPNCDPKSKAGGGEGSEGEMTRGKDMGGEERRGEKKRGEGR